MTLLTQRPRGTQDLLPEDNIRWRYIEAQMRKICSEYAYGEITTPVFEHAELFERPVGDATDIVEKEMYTFDDRGGRTISLRAEGTAPVARAYLENHLDAQAQPIKLAYVGVPVFRYEKPQAGRFRQHHQFGVEVFGSSDPAVDAEVISLAWELLNRLGLTDLSVSINNIGCPECRPNYRQALRDYYGKHLHELCKDCQARYDRNPLRLLDCKVDARFRDDAPVVLDYLCDDCSQHFEGLKHYLELLDVKYVIDPRIVRGLDYYTRTVFEISYTGLGSQSQVCGGGRYDGLIETIGGEPTPGVGFGMGMERLLATLTDKGCPLPEPEGLDLFIATIGQAARDEAIRQAYRCRQLGVSCDIDYLDRSLRAQLRYADKYPARFVVVLGDDELRSGQVSVKHMDSGSEFDVPLGELPAVLKTRTVSTIPADGGEEEG